jgi:phosphate-selective porin OprO/OprP
VTKTGKLGLMVGAATIAMISSAMAQATNADLEARVQQLEDRAIADRTRLSTLEQQYNYASWTFDNGRPVLSTGDGRFTMGVRIRFQTDFAGFSQDDTHPTGFAGPSDLSSGAAIRRAYFGVEGKVYNDFAYEIRLNAGGADGGSFGASGVPNAGEGDPLLNKAVVTYIGIPDWHFSVGVIEPSFMMEGTTSSANLTWLERPEIENIAADSFGAGDSRRGIELGWNHTDSLWAGDNLAADVAFTGGKTGSAQNHGSASAPNPGNGDENTQILGRFVDRLWSDGFSNVQIGASVAKVLDSGQSTVVGNTLTTNANGGTQTLRFRDRPEMRVDGTRLIDTGAVNAKTGDMWAVDLEGNLQNFYFEAEYASFTMDRQCYTGSASPVTVLTVANNPACLTAQSVIDHPTFHGFTLGASWIITGETKTYTPAGIGETQAGFGAPVPSEPFSLAGGSWGTWELVARYSDTDLNWHQTQLAVTNATGTSQLAGILGGEERVVALGVNWYLNRNVRLMLDDNIVSVKKGVAANLTRDSQDLNILGLRLQFAN